MLTWCRPCAGSHEEEEAMARVGSAVAVVMSVT